MVQSGKDSPPKGALNDATEFDALAAVFRALEPLTLQSRQRVLNAAETLLGLRALETLQPSLPLGPPAKSSDASPSFSKSRAPSPKEFLQSKSPVTLAERIACLAYYLAHYRETPAFKPIDLGKLNTEAAQPKFANLANAIETAVTSEFLAGTARGARRLTPVGEAYVQALPDRSAARRVAGLSAR